MPSYFEQQALWSRELVPQEQERLEIVKALLPPDIHTILDVGCGSGTLSNHLPEHLDITGLDSSAEALKYFKHRKVRGNASRLPFENGSFDLVLCSDVLEHLRVEDFEAAIAELKRVANKYLLIISPNEERLEAHQTQCEECRTVFHVNWHVRSLDLDSIVNLFQGEFELHVYTYFGGRWEQRDPILSRSSHFESIFDHWANAVCPICGAKQTDPPPNADVPSLLSNYLETEVGLHKRLVPLEILALLRRQGTTGFLDLAELQRHKHPQTLVTHAEHPGHLIRLVTRNRHEIYPADVAYTREDTCVHPPRGYVLVNRNMDWGETVTLEGKPARLYQTGLGQDGHAGFVMPWSAPSALNQIALEYFDMDDHEIHLQIYDSPQQQYLMLGKLSNHAGHRWQRDSFPIPSGIHVTDQGLFFRLVTPSPDASIRLPVHHIQLHSNAVRDPQELRNHLQIGPKELLASSKGVLTIYPIPRLDTLPTWGEYVITLDISPWNVYWVDQRGRWAWLGCYSEIHLPEWLWPGQLKGEDQEPQVINALRNLIFQRDDWKLLSKQLDEQTHTWKQMAEFLQRELQEQKKFLDVLLQESKSQQELQKQQHEAQELTEAQLHKSLQHQQDDWKLLSKQLDEQTHTWKQMAEFLQHELQEQKKFLDVLLQESKSQQHQQEVLEHWCQETTQWHRDSSERLHALERSFPIRVTFWWQKQLSTLKRLVTPKRKI